MMYLMMRSGDWKESEITKNIHCLEDKRKNSRKCSHLFHISCEILEMIYYKIGQFVLRQKLG